MILAGARAPVGVAREVEDEDSGSHRESLCGRTYRSTNHRFGQDCGHDSAMRTSSPLLDARAPNQYLRSSLRRPGDTRAMLRCPSSNSGCVEKRMPYSIQSDPASPLQFPSAFVRLRAMTRTFDQRLSFVGRVLAVPIASSRFGLTDASTDCSLS